MPGPAVSQMVHRCQLERDTMAGHSDTTNFMALGTPLPCYLWANAGREAVTGEKVTVVEDLRAVVDLGTDVGVLDRIHGVTDRAGTVVDPRLLEVQSVLTHRDHMELILQVVSQ
jgi:hypothetical protein